ncbi:FAD-dependent oxidoreductase [Georgenia daeguensis]|uniref:FAD-dependent oxidoreductase 2 FAD-binding domain-containing protein n=1 Tax=Georgenia daeguensis TaxID=908355 RepID=A0ABP8EXJ0_9MICO
MSNDIAASTLLAPTMLTEDTWDVVVLGTGVSGSAAAVTVARSGARVLWIEKSAEPGGSAALSAGLFWTAPNVRAYLDRIPLGNQSLAERLITDYPEALAEIRSTGITVADTPKHGVMTFGIGYKLDIRALLTWCRETVTANGGMLLTQTTATEIITDDERVTGVRLRTAEGEYFDVHAGAVVLATGGFQGDPEELSRHMGPNSDRLKLRSNAGSVGDGLRMARAVGAAATKGMSTFYGHLVPAPLRNFEPADYLPLAQFYSSHTVLLNGAGVRFCDETQGDEILNQELARQPGARGVLVFDDAVRWNAAREEPEPGLGAVDRIAAATGAGARYSTANTVEAALAPIEAWGFDSARASRTLMDYRRAIETGRRFADGVPVAESASPPMTAPFHVLEVQPTITFTLGGIRIDASGRVLDHDGAPIAGLFAAGADIGGISNYGYAGGLAPGYITGRWAGSSAARHAATGTAAGNR